MKKITRIEPTAAQPVMTKTKVAAYCRVSTEADAQLVSLETQQKRKSLPTAGSPPKRMPSLSVWKHRKAIMKSS